MQPLQNLRHEAFVLALASGSSPAEAYLEAGFTPKNRKARSQSRWSPILAACVEDHNAGADHLSPQESDPSDSSDSLAKIHICGFMWIWIHMRN